MLGAEAVTQPDFGGDKPLSAYGYNIEKDGKHLRTYRLTLTPGAQTGVHRYACPYGVLMHLRLGYHLILRRVLVVSTDTLKVDE